MKTSRSNKSKQPQLKIYKLRPVVCEVEVGLYRDDGIAVCRATPREKIKQEVSNTFKANGLKITIKAKKKKIVDFLDVTFDFASGSFKPYMKPNNKLLYVHRQSNHPPALLTNILLNINKRRFWCSHRTLPKSTLRRRVWSQAHLPARSTTNSKE